MTQLVEYCDNRVDAFLVAWAHFQRKQTRENVLLVEAWTGKSVIKKM
jgi:hypothetical protein